MTRKHFRAIAEGIRWARTGSTDAEQATIDRRRERDRA